MGLIYSIFRPSDDATIFPFLIPSNYFAVVSLRQAAERLIPASRRQGKMLATIALKGDGLNFLSAGAAKGDKGLDFTKGG